MFWTGEDITGAPVTVRIDFIRDLYASTPETRALEFTEHGAIEQIRQLSIEQSRLKWEHEDL